MVVISLSLVLSFSTSFAAFQTFFGEDLGQGEYTRLSTWPNALAAETAFLSNLVGVGTEDFESFTAPTADFGAAGIATIGGTGSVSYIPSGTNGVGRFPISGDNYWETGGTFYIDFSTAISAFGFYGIDIGDFNGQVELTYENGTSNTVNIGNSTNIAGGSVLYFGFYDTENLFTKITFGNTAGGVDYFGFDDFTIGTREQVVPTPEPATMLLLGFGLLGLVGLRRR